MKEWNESDYQLFENDSNKMRPNWTITVEIDTPDGITNSRLTRIISRALSDPKYLFDDEVNATSISAKLDKEFSVDLEARIWHRDTISI